MRKQHQRYRGPWWTRERVIEAMRRFYRDRGVAPTSAHGWEVATAGTAVSHNGYDNPYPSFATVLRHFASFRQAWTAAGVKVNRDWEEWTSEEDWFVCEGAGVYTRKELAEILDRTPDAVHRRLYDLGIDSRKNHGWTFHRVMRATGVPDNVLWRYADRGELPYFRGSKYCYIDPADLLIVREIDWNNPPAELAAAVRKSLVARLIKIIRREDWRKGRLYQVHRKRTTKKYHKRNYIAPGPKPVEIDHGDLVKARGVPELRGRVGLVHTVYWSSYGQMSNNGKSAIKRAPGWVARVEFKQTKAEKRLNRILPLDRLKKADS